MKTAILAIAALVSVVACSSQSEPSEVDTSVTSLIAQLATTAPPAPAAAHKLGDAVLIGGKREGDMAQYTVDNPRVQDGRYTLGVIIANKVGDALVPGTWEVLTAGGKKLKNVDYMTADGSYTPPEGMLETSGTLVAGEDRHGFIQFDIPAGDTATKLYLYYGTINPPVGVWSLK